MHSTKERYYVQLKCKSSLKKVCHCHCHCHCYSKCTVCCRLGGEMSGYAKKRGDVPGGNVRLPLTIIGGRTGALPSAQYYRYYYYICKKLTSLQLCVRTM